MDRGALFLRATPEFFAELARAFLMDEDGPGAKAKMGAYYCGKG